MPETDHRRGVTSPVGPTSVAGGKVPLARLLGLLMGVISEQLLARLAQAGFDDQRPAHNAVFANIPAEGIRLTDLADRAGISKQAMGELVADLEQLDYIERRPDPTDGRAKLIQFSRRGQRAVAAALEAFDDIEADLTRRIGKRSMNELRATLDRLTR